jgi:hypothetical protein
MKETICRYYTYLLYILQANPTHYLIWHVRLEAFVKCRRSVLPPGKSFHRLCSAARYPRPASSETAIHPNSATIVCTIQRCMQVSFRASACYTEWTYHEAARLGTAQSSCSPGPSPLTIADTCMHPLLLGCHQDFQILLLDMSIQDSNQTASTS